MKQAVMKKWVKALESGRYKQGKHRLCSISKSGTKSFCCLGVLCDLYNREMKSKKKKGLCVETIPGDAAETFELKMPDKVVVFNDNEGTLPDVVIKWAGFDTGNSEGWIGGAENNGISLIDLNDGNSARKIKKKSFKQISSFIKKNHENL